MLEHVPSPGDIIKSCSNLLNDNGDIFFSTINRNPKSYLFAVIGAEYVLNLLPKKFTMTMRNLLNPPSLLNG